jgi:hypothetical protein
MSVLLFQLIIQWIILILWILICVIGNLKKELPRFIVSLVLMFIPFGVIPLLLIFLYLNDKERDK